MIYHSQALILNTYNYGDTSLICTLFTEKYGKLGIIGKGVRSLKNSNRAILQPLNFIDIHYYFKKKRNIQILKEATLDKHFFKINNDYTKTSYAYNILDILNQICKTENPNAIVFKLSKTVLQTLNKCDNKHIKLYYVFFHLQLVRYLGYQPLLDYCNVCSDELIQAIYNHKHGQLECINCTNTNPNNISINKEGLQILKDISNTHIKNLITNISFTGISLDIITNYLLEYIAFHVLNTQQLKSLSLIK